MKTKLILFALFLLLSISAYAAPGIRISDYPNLSSLSSNKLLVIADPGVQTYNTSFGQITNQVLNSAELSNKVSSIAGSDESFWYTNAIRGGITNPYNSMFSSTAGTNGQLEISQLYINNNGYIPSILFWDGVNVGIGQISWDGTQFLIDDGIQLTSGAFSGNGSGLTNLNAANMSGVLTNNRSVSTTLSNTLTVSGNFTNQGTVTKLNEGNGSGAITFGSSTLVTSSGVMTFHNGNWQLDHQAVYLGPNVDNTRDLGASTKRWRNVFSTGLYIGGSNDTVLVHDPNGTATLTNTTAANTYGWLNTGKLWNSDGLQVGGTAAPTSGLNVSNSTAATGVSIGTNGAISASGNFANGGTLTVNSGGASGIGINTAGGTAFGLDILRADTTAFRALSSTAASSTSGSGLIGGSTTTPSAGDQRLGFLVFAGSSSQNAAGVTAFSSESWSGSGKGAYLRFETTTSGASTRTEKMRLSDAGNLTVSGTITGTNGVASYSSNQLAVTSITVTGSPFNWTNATTKNVFVFVNPGELTDVKINGTTIGDDDSFYSLPLQPGEWTTITYNVAPTMTWKPY